jgi:hypothetical protein
MAYPADYASVIMSVNCALWGAVSSSLRSVQVEFTEKEINIYCFFDGVISDDDSEDMSVVATEVAADFPDHQVYEHCIRADYPTPIKPTDKARHIVFWRKEG